MIIFHGKYSFLKEGRDEEVIDGGAGGLAGGGLFKLLKLLKL